MSPTRPQRLLGALVALVTLALGLPAAPASARAGCGGAAVATGSQDLPGAARAVRCLVNAERRLRALAPVRSSGKLRRAAAGHSTAMLSSGAFAHRVPGEQALAGRVRVTGYLHHARSWMLGEAIAYGQGEWSSPAGLVRALMHSPAHRAIILDGHFDELGVGLLSGVPAGDGACAGATLTLDFGRARHR